MQFHPVYPVSYITDILQNYIPLSYPYYIQNIYTQKVDKPMIYVMIEIETYDNI